MVAEARELKELGKLSEKQDKALEKIEKKLSKMAHLKDEVIRLSAGAPCVCVCVCVCVCSNGQFKRIGTQRPRLRSTQAVSHKDAAIQAALVCIRLRLRFYFSERIQPKACVVKICRSLVVKTTRVWLGKAHQVRMMMPCLLGPACVCCVRVSSFQDSTFALTAGGSHR